MRRADPACTLPTHHPLPGPTLRPDSAPARAHIPRANQPSSSPSLPPSLPAVCGPEALAIGMARVGQDRQAVISGTLAQLATVDFGAPLHSLVLVGPALHDLERALVEHYRVKGDEPQWTPPPQPRVRSDSGDSDGSGPGY